MAEANDTHGTAFKHGSATLLARVVGADGVNLVQADVAAIKYSIYLLDDADPDARTAVSGHSEVALEVAGVVFDELQNDALWTVDAVGYNWSETYEQLQRKVTEHAWGAVIGKGEKVLCFNFLTRITKDCDCMGSFEPISPDIGILFAKDPVALDAASLDLLEERAGRKMSRLAYDIPYRVQLDHACDIGFGTTDYHLIEIR